MSAFVSEIRALATFITPKGWLKCEGQELLIENYPDLFSVIGINYGGDGTTTFKIPNLVGRSILGQDNGDFYPLGSAGGSARQTLLEKNLPAHKHGLNVSNGQSNQNPPIELESSLASFAVVGAPQVKFYTNAPPSIALAPDSISKTGEGESFSVQSPYLAMSYFISLYGVLPTAEAV